ncbi:MAG: hypothetical protein LKF61_03640 [Eggerthellaceae bacterium]|jgi:hypothetical protein|nr:hypothetical protein [Eggerthellaceae bacterium]MCH4221011.1 hypothetical protein [Eggerthellaceae bacterium]
MSAPFTPERTSADNRFQRRHQRKAADERALIIEMIAVLFFVALCVAVVIQLFAQSASDCRSAHDTSCATRLARCDAEQFNVSPDITTGVSYFDVDGNPSDTPSYWTLTRTVTPEQTEVGTIYHATVHLLSTQGTTYDLSTACYKSNGEEETL